MSNFKLAKKDALSYTRTNIYDLHEKKLDSFETEKRKLPELYLQLQNEDTLELRNKIYNLENDTDLNDYLLEFWSIINKSENGYQQINQKGVMDSFVDSTINNTKSEMYNEYIKHFNPELTEINIPHHKASFCTKCKNEVFIFEEKSSTSICTKCGLSVNTIYNDTTSPVYTENIEQVIVFNYKRNNHFQECLNQLQAKENTTIPPKIISDLTFEFKKYNITDPKLFTSSLVKSYLKKLKYNKYYEHIPTIINEFCGLTAPKLTPELEQQLKIMFDEIQVPFEKYSALICPDRKNFLNYNYTFYKMCQLLSKDEFLNFFPLLKSREKLYEHDLIWKGICSDLHWEYIPSI
jgi:hypothetical protein